MSLASSEAAVPKEGTSSKLSGPTPILWHQKPQGWDSAICVSSSPAGRLDEGSFENDSPGERGWMQLTDTAIFIIGTQTSFVIQTPFSLSSLSGFSTPVLSASLLFPNQTWSLASEASVLAFPSVLCSACCLLPLSLFSR